MSDEKNPSPMELAVQAEALAARAAEGPWIVDERFRGSMTVFVKSLGETTDDGGVSEPTFVANPGDYERNAEFIAWTRLGVPALCAAVRHQTEYTEELLYALECIHLMATSSGFDMEPHELLDAIDKRAQEARGE